MEPYFQLDGNTAIASQHCSGPWDPTLLHGGAPTALITHIVERLPSEVPMLLTRLTIDLKRPVPIGELEIGVEMTREGRNIQTADVTLSARGKEVVRASALKIRKEDQILPDGAQLDRPAPPRSALPRPFFREGVGFAQGIDLYQIEDLPIQAHDGGWFRINRPFIGGAVTSPLMKAAATGDFCNAFGAALDIEKWTFINADLTLHFAREPVGDWMMLAAKGWLGGDGRGLSFGELADDHGYFGRAVQSLVIAKR